MAQSVLIKNYLAGAAISPYRIVAHGASDTYALQAGASSDALMGISVSVGAGALDERIDVEKMGIVLLEYGGTVVRGDPVTSDASGRGVKATPAASVQTSIAGGAAGAHALTGIATTDTLVSVIHVDATDASEAVTDLTAEFSISAADTIDNTGGTNTTGGFLLLTYRHPGTRIIGYADVSAVSGDIADCYIAIGQFKD